ncbi:MAG TPA: hypothetical protein VN428_06700 [Bryobacteraceae bacterium]|nr:hypothetical protein [Bryobacteraceae bacterium]
MNYTSEITIEAQSVPGVRFTIARMSFGRRLELTKRISAVARKVEYLEAGGDDRERIEAAVLAGEIDRTYLEWGLRGVQGLKINGAEATPADAIERGPEALAREIAAAIKHECGLSEEERKN